MTNIELLKRVFSCIDNTSLNGNDTKDTIRTFCSKTLLMCSPEEGINNVASVCVYPLYTHLAKDCLKDSTINVASVVACFPSSMAPLSIKLKEVDYVLSEGADELDMVINRGLLLEGDYRGVAKEIEDIRKISDGKTLKVILETGELKSVDNIKIASKIAIESGADFLKTSTGKSSIGATVEAADVMLSVIKNNYINNNRLIGFKVSGGISTVEDALAYSKLAIKHFGIDYIDKQYFRIGASRLTERLFNFLT